MSQLLKGNKYICCITFYFADSESLPVQLHNETDGAIGFFNNAIIGDKKEKPKFSRGSFTFNETMEEGDHGPVYNTSVNFRFLSNDFLREKRIDDLRKVRFIGLGLTNSEEIIIGRNDREQNTKPDVSVSSNLNFTEVRFRVTSMMPSGFKRNQFGYPLQYDFTYYN